LFVAAARGRGPATEVLAARQGVVPGASTAAAGGVHGFPAPLTSFIGRAGAVHEVMGLLEQYRLVTVTGPGGVGKTRLAGEVAGWFANGVWLAELAAVQDPAKVPVVVAAEQGRYPCQTWTPPAEVERSEAVALFADRARQADVVSR